MALLTPEQDLLIDRLSGITPARTPSPDPRKPLSFSQKLLTNPAVSKIIDVLSGGIPGSFIGSAGSQQLDLLSSITRPTPAPADIKSLPEYEMMRKDFEDASLSDAFKILSTEAKQSMIPAKQTFPEQIASGFGSAVGFAPVAATGGGLAKLLSLSPKMATGLASLFSAGAESELEGVQAKERAIEKGMTPEEAQKAKDKSFALNLPFIAATNMPGWIGRMFGKMAGKPVGKVAREGAVKAGLKSILPEAGQEAYQSGVGDIVVDEKIDPKKMAESALIGGIVGGGMGGVVGAQDKRATQAELMRIEKKIGEVTRKAGEAIPIGKRGEIIIPDFKGTEPAQAFGKTATPEQVKALQDKENQLKARVDEINKIPAVERPDALDSEGYSIGQQRQFIREALEAKGIKVEGKPSVEPPKTTFEQSDFWPEEKEPLEITPEKQPIQEQAEMEIETLSYTGGQHPLEKAMKAVGKIRAQALGKEAEEYREIPVRFRSPSGKPIDEIVQELEMNHGIVFESDSELRQALKDLGEKQQRFTLSPEVQTYLKTKSNVEATGKKLEGKLSPSAYKKIVYSNVGLRPSKTPFVSTKEKMLKYTLKQREIAARGGEKAGIKTGITQEKEKQVSTRTAAISSIKNAFEWKIQNIKRKAEIGELKQDIIDRDKLSQEKEKLEIVKDVKKRIAEYIRESLPLDKRGKFISTIANAKTVSNLSSAFRKIDKEVSNIERRTVLDDIKTKIKEVADSSKIDIVYRNMIKDITDGIDLVKRRTETMDGIRKLKEYIKSREEKGETVLMPGYVLERLKILTRRPVTEMTTAELKNIQTDIELLQKTGEMRLTTEQQIYNLQKDNILTELEKDSQPLERFAPKQAEISGENISKKDKIMNVLKIVLNTAKDKGWSITPVNSVFDQADGGTGTYDKANFRNFKQRTDTDYSGYLRTSYEFIKGLSEALGETKLSRKQKDRILIYEAKNQEGGLEKLLALGVKKETIDTIKLTDVEMRYYKLLRKGYDRVHPLIKKVMADVFDEDVGFVRNYSPFFTDFLKMSEAEIRDRFGDNSKYYLKKNVDLSRVQERKGGAVPIKADPIDNFVNYMDNAAYLINMSKNIRMLTDIAKSNRYRNSAGEIMQETVLEWLDLLARKGGTGSAGRINGLDILRRNVGVARLGLNPSSILIQPTALLDGAMIIGNDAFSGFYQVLSSPEIRKVVLNNFPEIKARVGDDPAFMDFGDIELWNKMQKAGYAPLRFLDGITAAGIGWGAYTKKMRELNLPIDLENLNEKALQYAQQVVQRSQSSAAFKDLPLALSKGKFTGNVSVDKSFFQFQSFLLSRWDNTYNYTIKGKLLGGRKFDPESRDYRAAAVALTYLILALLLETGIRRKVNDLLESLFDDETKDKYDEGFVHDLTQNFTQTIPFVSPMVSVADYNGNLFPVLDAITDAIAAPKKIIEGKKPETRIRGMVNLAGGAAVLSGIPGAGIATRLIKSAISANSKENVVELYKQSMLEKDKEKEAKADALSKKLGLSIKRMKEKAEQSLKRKETSNISEIEEKLHTKSDEEFKSEINKTIKSGKLSIQAANKINYLRQKRLKDEQKLEGEIQEQKGNNRIPKEVWDQIDALAR